MVRNITLFLFGVCVYLLGVSFSFNCPRVRTTIPFTLLELCRYYRKGSERSTQAKRVGRDMNSCTTSINDT